MIDRQNVIKGLKCHQIDDNHRINCSDCPYCVDDDNYIRCENNLHDDAIALLIEQEEKQEPKQVIDMVEFAEGMKTGRCPSCARSLVSLNVDEAKFCKSCGQAVKWE